MKQTVKNETYEGQIICGGLNQELGWLCKQVDSILLKFLSTPSPGWLVLWKPAVSVNGLVFNHVIAHPGNRDRFSFIAIVPYNQYKIIDR